MDLHKTPRMNGARTFIRRASLAGQEKPPAPGRGRGLCYGASQSAPWGLALRGSEVSIE